MCYMHVPIFLHTMLATGIRRCNIDLNIIKTVLLIFNVKDR